MKSDLDAQTERDAEIKAEGEAAKTAAQGAHSSATSSSVAAVNDFKSTMSVPSERGSGSFDVPSSAPNWQIQYQGVTIDADPFKADRFGPVCGWFKAALGWVVMGWFAVWLVGETREIITGMSQAQQSKGALITVVGNGTTAVTAFVVAGVITVAFAVGITGIVVYFTKDLGAGSVMTWATGNPYAGAPGGVAYVLDQVFPLGIMAACLVGRVVFGLGLQVIFGVFATIVRFCLA